jgi:hypothetical protein
MKILLLKQIVPLAAFGVAMAGAFGTNTVERNQRAVGPIASFEKQNLAGDCKQLQHTCQTDNIGPVCRVGGTGSGAQLWAKDVNGKCNVEVYMPQP